MLIREKRCIKNPKVEAVCLEFLAPKKFIIKPREVKKINTGIKRAMPKKIVGALTSYPPNTKVKRFQRISNERKADFKRC